MKRKRKHIPMIEIAASALADKLRPDEVKALRNARVSARFIVTMFTPDHIVLHAWGGEDKWWNINMALRGPKLKAKDAADTRRVAKARHIEKKWRPFTAAMARGKKPPKRKSVWPKRKMRRAR